MMGEPPSKEYQAYNMQEGKPVNKGGETQYYEQVGQHETDMNYTQQQQQEADQPSANPFRAAPSSNPFRS